MDTTIARPNGDITPYGFACGYIQSDMVDGTTGYYSTTANGVALSMEGTIYHVKVREDGVTYENGFPIRTVDGDRLDWHVFDNLTDARKFYRKTAKRLHKS